MDFNPYRDWLGLSGGRPHAFDLLGISIRETNPESIRSAGVRRIELLEALDPGPHATQRERLIREVKQAVEVLVDPPRRDAYLTKLRAARDAKRATEPASATESTAAPTAASATDTASGSDDAAMADPFDPMAPLAMAPATPQSPGNASPTRNNSLSPQPTPFTTTTSEANSAVLQRHLEARRQGRRLSAIVAAILVVVGAVMAWIGFDQRDQIIAWLTPSNTPGQGSTPATNPNPTETEQPSNPSAGDSTSPNAEVVVSQDPKDSDATSESESEMPATDPDSSDPSLPEGDPETSDPPTEPGEAPGDDPESSDPPPPSDEPSDSSPQLDLPQSYALANLLKEVQLGLTTPEETGVDVGLEQAQALAANTPDAKLVERLQLVVQTNRRFWQVVAECCGALESSQELAFDASTVVVVVEASSERIVYRVNGQRQERVPRALPPGLARFIVETIRPDNEENPLLIGALYAAESAKDSSRREVTESLWREIETESSELDALLDWLNDDYAALVSRHKPTAPPDAESLAAAQAEIEPLWSEKREAAKRPDQRIALADEIIAAATQLQASPQAYAHFLAALDLIGTSGRSRKLEPALAIFSAWFSIDPITVSIDVLEKASRVAGEPEDHTYTVETSLSLAEKAIGKQQTDETERLLDIATDAAQRSKNNELRATTLQQVRMLKQRLANP